MITHLYRFRPVERLLGGELAHQQIYFAKPEKLNDPMEGFRDIYWRGDAIVWSNLLRHFVLCVERAFSLFMILGEEQPLTWDVIPVFNHGDTSFTPQQKEKQEEILDAFFAEDCVSHYVGALASRAQPVRRAELSAHLRFLHPLTILLVQECYRRHGLVKTEPVPPDMLDRLRDGIKEGTKAIDAIRILEEESGAQAEFKTDMFYTAQLGTLVELDLIHLYNGTINPKDKNRNLVFVTFCDEFVHKIETLVYPPWYTACFMEECRNSSVWGNYGHNHTAACLKFKVKDVNGRPCLPLYRIAGLGSGGPTKHHVDHEFHPVTYENQHLPVDFFGSLGRLPIPVLSQYWYGDRKGNFSRCGDAILKNQEAWRKVYWEAFQHAITRKLTDWHHEREHRLLLTGEMDFQRDEDRTVTYDFEYLDGIIFGLKTPSDTKLELFKIVEEKCRAHNRTDFKFYQAYYARATGTIEHAELSFLKFEF
jgi:hypothetical protein